MEYKNWTIEPDTQSWFKDGHVAYPTSQGRQDDGDFDGEDWHYCGNAKFGTIEDLKDQIDEITE